VKRIIVALLVFVSAPALAQSPTTNVFGLDFTANNTQAVSGANHGRIRYNSGTQKFEISANGGAYTTLGATTLQQAYTAGGANGGEIILNTTGGPISVFPNDDAINGFAFTFNSVTETGNAFEVFDGANNPLMKVAPLNVGGTNAVEINLTSQINGSYPFLTATTVGSSPVTFSITSSILQESVDGYQFLNGPSSIVYASLNTSGFGTFRSYNNAPQTVAFSATPAFDCTISDQIVFGPVTANITTVTMTDGLDGEHCTIVMQKNTSASAFTVTNSWGANVRATNSTFNTASQSVLVYRFVWSATATPSWVEESTPQSTP
jgi:hypothetical protein